MNKSDQHRYTVAEHIKEESAKAKKAFAYSVIIAYFCLLSIFFLPNDALGIIIKVALGLWLISTLYASHLAPARSYYKTMGAAVTIETILFAGMLVLAVSSESPLLATGVFVIMLIHWRSTLLQINKGYVDAR